MKTARILVMILLVGMLLSISVDVAAQCSICTKTASQLGEKPAKALNGAIVYLAAAPILIMSFIGYRWWKHNR
ncbi:MULTISPECIES: hypothetical protein [unclassified Paraflavitalea]|uniref:hypothetical protein n=1 Tax=unclassified Paraflavitalea TaxID=2798305 RepID=UPI003D349824